MTQYNNSLKFWDDVFGKMKAEKIEDWDLGSETLQQMMADFIKDKKMVLDFACGAGWASHFFAWGGSANVLGLDQSANAIKVAKDTAKMSNYENLKFLCKDDSYLSTLTDETFDGIFSNNFFDVVPTQVAERTLMEISRLLKKDGEIMIVLNYYLTPESIEKNKMVNYQDNCYSIDDNLRCVNRTSDEWKELFGRYLRVEDYVEFNYNFDKAKIPRRIFKLTKLTK